MTDSSIILEAQKIRKVFSKTIALDKVNFKLNKGEVRALVGENGAGKTTLVKILTGAYQPDEGEIFLQGEKIVIPSPNRAQHLGISIVYQDFNLIPNLSVAKNILLGKEPRKSFGIIDFKELEKKAQELIAILDLNLNLNSLVNELSVANQQMVAIVRALSVNPKILILDEPTASLPEEDVQNLFKLIMSLKKKGVSIIFISHRLEEIFKIADSVTVLKDGKIIDTKKTDNVTQDQLIKMMVGREFVNIFPPKAPKAKSIDTKEPIFSIKNLNLTGVLKDINFNLYKNEILTLTGLEGQGQRELVRSIFGVAPMDSGKIIVDNREIKISNPRDAIRAGIGFLSDDRKIEGLALCRPISENISLLNLKNMHIRGFVKREKEKKIVKKQIENLDIKIESIQQPVQYLSGGNQQKVIISKWLLPDPKIIIFDEPTIGIDVGTKVEIYHRLRELANEGKGIIMLSSDMLEVIGMSDRVLVMFEGRISAEISGQDIDEKQIMIAAAG